MREKPELTGYAQRQWCRAAAILGVAVAVLAGCTFRGNTNAVSQRFTWFSDLKWDEIQAACGHGSRDRYRFVYKGN